MSLVLVQRGTWPGWANADIYLESRGAAAFFTAAHDYMKETGRPMPEIAEPMGGLRYVAQTTEMQWAFDYGPHGMHRGTATAAQRAKSAELYAHYNMSTVSTARPAITGTHTTGLFFDVATAAFLIWLLINGHRYGISRPLLNDPNHCQVNPGTETAALSVTSLDGASVTTRGDNMPTLIEDRGPQGTTLTGNIWWATENGDTAKVDLSKFPDAAHGGARAILEKTFGPIIGHTSSDFGAVMSVYAAIKAARPAISGGTAPADYYSDADAARDLKVITAAIAAGDVSVLKAIAAAPAETLAAFGLKRA